MSLLVDSIHCSTFTTILTVHRVDPKIAIETDKRSKYVIPAQAGIQSLSLTWSGFLLPQE